MVNTYQGSLGNPISSFTYLLDATGNRLKVTDGSGKATSYGYDVLNELKSVTVGTNVADPVASQHVGILLHNSGGHETGPALSNTIENGRTRVSLI